MDVSAGNTGKVDVFAGIPGNVMELQMTPAKLFVQFVELSVLIGG
jgi:hypothetical protein